MLTQNLNVGWAALAVGDWALAEQSFQRAQRLATGLADLAGELRARLGLAQARLRQGQFDAARRGSNRRWTMRVAGGMLPPFWQG